MGDRVDERRLADAARAEQGDRAVAGGVGGESFDAGALPAADDVHPHPEGDVGDGGDAALDEGVVVDEVALGQHHDRRGPGIEGEHELALEPPLVRWHERVHEADDVDVRGDRVRLGADLVERRRGG